MFGESDTCEFVCLSLAKKLGITPAMLCCFGLGMFDVSQKKYYWLAPRQKPGEVSCNLAQMQDNDVYFRMRFLPEQSRCVQLDEVDPKCLEYLTWQVEWDFLHSYLSCLNMDEARGISCMLIFIKLRINTVRENCAENVKSFMRGKDVNDFLPVSLRETFLKKIILKDNMLKKVESLRETYPARRCSPHYLMKWCLQVVLRQHPHLYSETFVAYDPDIDSEEFESIDDEDDQPSQIVKKRELVVSVEIDNSYPRLIVSKKNARADTMIDCYLENISKLEISQIQRDIDIWWRIQLLRKDGHPEMLYFEDRNEMYSFATCVEGYRRLIYDFEDSVCQELESSSVRELYNRIRAHGPVSLSLAAVCVKKPDYVTSLAGYLIKLYGTGQCANYTYIPKDLI